jgi:hypothetical protein
VHCKHGGTKPWLAGTLGPDFPHGLQRVKFYGAASGEGSLLVCSFCYLWNRGSCGSYLERALFSLAFQGEGGRLCSRGEHGAPSSCACWRAGLMAKPTQSNAA